MEGLEGLGDILSSSTEVEVHGKVDWKMLALWYASSVCKTSYTLFLPLFP
jgi:hypothetical protein